MRSGFSSIRPPLFRLPTACVELHRHPSGKKINPIREMQEPHATIYFLLFFALIAIISLGCRHEKDQTQDGAMVAHKMQSRHSKVVRSQNPAKQKKLAEEFINYSAGREISTYSDLMAVSLAANLYQGLGEYEQAIEQHNIMLNFIIEKYPIGDLNIDRHSIRSFATTAIYEMFRDLSSMKATKEVCEAQIALLQKFRETFPDRETLSINYGMFHRQLSDGPPLASCLKPIFEQIIEDGLTDRCDPDGLDPTLYWSAVYFKDKQLIASLKDDQEMVEKLAKRIDEIVQRHETIKLTYPVAPGASLREVMQKMDDWGRNFYRTRFPNPRFE